MKKGKARKLQKLCRLFSPDPSIDKYFLKEEKVDTILYWKETVDSADLKEKIQYLAFPYFEGVWTEDKLHFEALDCLQGFCNYLKIKLIEDDKEKTK